MKEDLNNDGKVTMQEKILAAACLPVILKALNPNEPSFGFTKKA